MNFKEELYNQCIEYVKGRMAAAQDAIDAAQQAAKDDTKSSAGDKYETGREMMQQETDRNMAQLAEANKLKIALTHISISANSTIAEAGSVIITNNGNFYLSISAGVLTLGEAKYFAVSPASPIGMMLRGKQAGQQVSLNGKNYTIQEVL